MQDARRHPRTTFRLAVDLFSGTDATRRTCLTRDIGIGGLFAVGAQQYLEPDEPIQVAIGPDQGRALHLEGRVARVNGRGAGIEFVGNSPATMEVFATLLTPKWDGKGLLDGVLMAAPWQHDHDLADWMRLTSLVSEWQHMQPAADPAGSAATD